MIKFLISTFFYIFLPNLNILRTLELTFWDFYFREFTAAINFACSKPWFRIGINDVIYSKIPYGLKLFNN